MRLITPPTPKLLDPIFRDAHLKRIHHLRRAYRLDWLVDQATFNVAAVSCLEDCDLIRLLNDMERARECIFEGVSFEDADLVRPVQAPDVEPAPRPDVRWSRSTLRDAERAEMRASNDDQPVRRAAASMDPPF